MKNIIIYLSLLMLVSCVDKNDVFFINTDRVVANPTDLNFKFTEVQQRTTTQTGMQPPTGAGLSTNTTLQGQNSFNVASNASQAPISTRRVEIPGSREAADPVCLIYNDTYYLFVSKSGGYWSSDDMVKWKYITSEILPGNSYAPAAMVYDGYVYWMVGNGYPNTIYKSNNPDDGESWEVVLDNLEIVTPDNTRTGERANSPGDAYFFNDNGRIYIYYGLGAPIRGVELDPKNNFAMIGEPIILIDFNYEIFGWENTGDKNELHGRGCNEGSSIIKYNGKYYLKYSSPGTEYETYGEGLYIGDNPLGPFTHVDYSPMCIKPGGWMTGAGHGDTFLDKYGNLWCTESTVISQRKNFERRIGFFPVIVTEKGNMYALTEFSDYPYIIPDKKVDFLKESPWTGWMNLSLNKEVTASSTLDGFDAEKASDYVIKTWWSAETGNPGEWFQMDLGAIDEVWAIHVNFADEGFKNYDKDNPKPPYQYIVEGSKDGVKWQVLADLSSNNVDNPHQLITLDEAAKIRYVKISNLNQLEGKFSLFGLRVFGFAKGVAPTEVTKIKAVRNEDPRRFDISWEDNGDATGYILRWGTDPDELFLTCEVYEPFVEMGLFTIGVDYYFSVDAFNESGLTKGSIIVSSNN